MSGMRFNEGGQGLRARVRVRVRLSVQAKRYPKHGSKVAHSIDVACSM